MFGTGEHTQGVLVRILASSPAPRQADRIIRLASAPTKQDGAIGGRQLTGAEVMSSAVLGLAGPPPRV